VVVDNHRVLLRAERSASGSGRVYTIGVACRDGANNLATRSLLVNVPLEFRPTEYVLDWAKQFGTASDDSAEGVSADGAGNAYVGGNTWGAFGGHTNAGAQDVFLRKYSPEGRPQWTQQTGTRPGDGEEGPGDVATAVAVDRASDHVYLAGYTTGSFPNAFPQYRPDYFVGKYDRDGASVWLREHGTGDGDRLQAATVDRHGDLVMSGWTGRRFGGAFAAVQKVSPQGQELWARRFAGTTDSVASYGIAIDAESNVYVAGFTAAALPAQINAGGKDAFVVKFDPDGNQVWARQFGTPQDDIAYGVAIGLSGVIYVVGETKGTWGREVSKGSGDAFLRALAANGDDLWTRQFGSGGDDSALAVATDAGRIYVTGTTAGQMPGQRNRGGVDAFLRVYNLRGRELSTVQFGSEGIDVAESLAVDPVGRVFVAGHTDGALRGHRHRGGTDAFLARFVPARRDRSARE
jgi:hypothetical protein